LAASVTRIPDVGAGAVALWWLSAAVYLALAFAVQLIAMLAAMSSPGSAGRLRGVTAAFSKGRMPPFRE
jgi:hypothetical protein